MYLADIKRDDRFEGYLIVRSAEAARQRQRQKLSGYDAGR